MDLLYRDCFNLAKSHRFEIDCLYHKNAELSEFEPILLQIFRQLIRYRSGLYCEKANFTVVGEGYAPIVILIAVLNSLR